MRRRRYIKAGKLIVGFEKAHDAYAEANGYRRTSLREIRRMNAYAKVRGLDRIRMLHPKAYVPYLQRYPEMLPWYEGVV
jgi:hypothetical protein